MKYLFFFVHPSKYYVFRETINHLIRNNHSVEILITSKDILEPLVKNEGWKYSNIFPEGRKLNLLPTLIGASFNAFRTIYRLLKYVHKKEYNLFITDDLLSIPGRILKIPTCHFQDDDLTVVPESFILLHFANHILSPEITDLKRYNKKKIAFHGYKELAYLHPNYFNPDISVVRMFNPELKKYYLIRCVSLKSTHDRGKKGISNHQLEALIELFSKYGNVYISSERPLPVKLEKYRILLPYNKIAHALYYAQIFVSDSQTMTSEASVLGTPAIRFNDFVGKINVMDEKEKKYSLSYSYSTKEFDKVIKKITELIEIPDLKNIYYGKRKQMLEDCLDLTRFMIWLFEYYPQSINTLKNNKSYIDIFKSNENTYNCRCTSSIY